ncbi:MAG: hypothetical protein M0Q14_11120 [Tissierellaceae bacterium]|nr:hypothetical protein [Tissierellaceae bacterium]
MTTHDKNKNLSEYFETAIVGIGIIAMALTSIVLAGIKLVEYIAKYI